MRRNFIELRTKRTLIEVFAIDKFQFSSTFSAGIRDSNYNKQKAYVCHCSAWVFVAVFCQHFVFFFTRHSERLCTWQHWKNARVLFCWRFRWVRVIYIHEGIEERFIETSAFVCASRAETWSFFQLLAMCSLWWGAVRGFCHRKKLKFETSELKRGLSLVKSS